jgi:hypothetical protein
MGKSSLMARAAKRLSEAGLYTAIVDLTTVGTEKEKQSAAQWYYGIAHRVLRELGLRDIDLNQWWQSRLSLPALQRLMEFFSDLLLEQVAGQIVIFIDEIDSTISLPFTDDFFAAIRACYNARATEPDYKRLSFVLLGVASPSDLMKDNKRTPFNIGHRIELTDFTADEAKPLVARLNPDSQESEQILPRILHWTGGHPYLTQKLCQTIQNRDTTVTYINEGYIDAAVEEIFLSEKASREDSNLNYIRNWLTDDNKISREILETYISILQGEKITDVPLSNVQNKLKLSGIITLRSDRTLRIRNSIYVRVFTGEWGLLGISAKLKFFLGGHSPHAQIACGFYAALFAIALLAEIAYQFDRYGRAGILVAGTIFCWIFVTSLAGLVVDWKFILAGRNMGLVVALVIFLCAAIIAFVGAYLLLPAATLTELITTPTATARMAYLKDVIYHFTLIAVFLLPTFHFVLAIQRELQAGRHLQTLYLLTGNKLSVAPRDLAYPRFWFLLAIALAISLYSIYAHHNLMSKLQPGPYQPLFALLVQIRLAFFYILIVKCLYWYSDMLNEIKRECLVAVRFGRMSA